VKTPEKRQMTCKPGSVLTTGKPVMMDDHSSATPVTGRLVQPTRTAARKRAMRSPYSVLLPVGFTVPRLLPAARCAFTAPFHPYLRDEGGLLSVALSLGSPPPDVIRHRASVEPGLSSTLKEGSGHPVIWRALACLGCVDRSSRNQPTKGICK